MAVPVINVPPLETVRFPEVDALLIVMVCPFNIAIPAELDVGTAVAVIHGPLLLVGDEDQVPAVDQLPLVTFDWK